ncbi:MAG: response regulator [Bdellovibrionales bacterium]|nr:response regulator [Bdellovibrionales bacterium]
MPHLRSLTFGFFCGLCAFFGYIVEANIVGSGEAPFSLSQFFIYLPMLTVGAEGALVAFSVGTLPCTLFNDGTLRLPVQAAVVLFALFVQQKKFREIQPYQFALNAWVMILIPLRLVFPQALWHGGIPLYYLGLQTLIDLFLVSSANALPFIPWVSESIIGKPYQPNREKLFATVCGALLSLSLLSGVLVSPDLLHPPQPNDIDFSILLILTVLLSGIAAFGARWFEVTIAQLSPGSTRSRLSSAMSLLPEDPTTDPLRMSSLSDSRPPSALLDLPGVCALTHDGKIMFVNQKFQQLTELTDPDPTDKEFVNIPINEELRTNILTLLKKLPEGMTLSDELKINQLPRTLRFFSIGIEPHAREDQQGHLITLQDITDRRSLESHLFESHKIKSLGSIMGGLSHAFNNSLTTIVGLASTALIESQQIAYQSALSSIHEEAKKVSGVIRKLLNFSEGKTAEFTHIHLSEFLQENVEFLQKLVGEEIELEWKAPTNQLYTNGEPNLLMQVLTELVTNAKEGYREKPGTITIELSSEEIGEDIARLHKGAHAGRYARLTVKDSGCGMSSDTVTNAFSALNPDHRFHGSRGGVGLSVVYAIVRAHEGFINLESFPERGTTVYIYLPIIETLQNDTQDPEVIVSAPTGEILPVTSAKILVVEDEPGIRDLLKKMLSLLGHGVTTCSNASEALERCKLETFDLILVDYIMPKRNGVQFISELKATSSNPDAHFILMSGCGRNADVAHSDIPLLAKPFDIETLKNTVETELARIHEKI